MNLSKGLKPGELEGQISFDKWFFRLAFSQPGLFLLCGRAKLFDTAAEISYSVDVFFLFKDDFFTLPYNRDRQLSNECCKTFL
jgi:hypothetical protein